MRATQSGIVGVLLLGACAQAQWQSERAEHPASRAELASCRVTVAAEEPLAGELRQALAELGFTVVAHAPYKSDLKVRAGNGAATLTSDDFFVDEVRAPDAAGLAQALAVSRRVAELIRNSGTVEQRNVVN
jgi:hypothetical protein